MDLTVIGPEGVDCNKMGQVSILWLSFVGEPCYHSRYNVQATGSSTVEFRFDSWQGQETYLSFPTYRSVVVSTQPFVE
jgi:hypothetical protein